MNNNKKFKYQLALISIIRNEADYMKEWIEYHKMIGVEIFFIYDDGSTDNIKEVLKPYIESGLVVVSDSNGKWNQTEVYHKTILKHRNKCKYMGVLDIDEFIVPINKENIRDVIKELFGKLDVKTPALAIHWITYGFCGCKEKPEGLVIENYQKSDKTPSQYKSIFNPRLVLSATGAHSCRYVFGKPALNEKGTKIYDEWQCPASECIKNKSEAGVEHIRINHYWTKSYEEYCIKMKRNKERLHLHNPEMTEIAEKIYKILPYDPDYLSHHEDRVMDKYIIKLKDTLNKAL
jgi:hypothetical protein